MTRSAKIPDGAVPARGMLQRLGPLTPEQERLREECLAVAYEVYVRAWLDELPIAVDETPTEDDRGLDRWMRLLDTEYVWLVATGRMPPHETGLYALEAHRLGIYPTYGVKEAAALLGVDVEELTSATLGGELACVPAYNEIHIGVSALYAYASARGRSVALPAGGEWLDVSDAERRALRAEHERHVLETVNLERRAMCVEALELDAARAEAYLASQFS